ERIRLEDTAAQFIAELRAIQPEGPYLLGGYCFGGLVAFEIARQLRAAGQQVSLLLLMDPGLPPGQSLSKPDGALQTARRTVSSGENGGDLRERVSKGSRQRVRATRDWFSHHARGLSALSGRERWGYLFIRVRGTVGLHGGMALYRLYRICRP